jgi:biotin carboxyl carrier protein
MEKLTMALNFSIDGETRQIEIIRRRPSLVLRIAGKDYVVEEESGPGPRRRLRIDGAPVEFVAVSDGDIGFVRLRARTWQVSLVNPSQAAGGVNESANDIRAPMPGIVVSVHKAEGDAVRRGETIVTIESMKLQMALAAPRDGIIARLIKKVDETFDRDEIVATLVVAGAAE